MLLALRSVFVLGLAAAFVAGCSSDSSGPASLRDAGGGGNDAGMSGADGSQIVDAGAPSGDASQSSDAAPPGFDAGSADSGSPIIDECNPVTQMGCADPMMMKCIVENSTPMGGTRCVPRGTDVGLGMACTGEDCLAGLACVRTSSITAECEQVCDFGTGEGCDQLGNDFECGRRLTGTNWGACIQLGPLCDPLMQTPCTPDQACQPVVRRTGQWEFRCRTAGTQGEGIACGAGNGTCQRGLVCIRSQMMGSVVCRRYCDMNEDCAMPEMCTGEVTEPPFMYCSP